MRVETHKARKEFVDVHGGKIMPGETYYEWKPYRGTPRRSKTAPSKIELTGNERQAALYEAEANIADALRAFDDDPSREEGQSLADVLSNAVSELEDVASEYEESADNIENTFTSSETADLCRERADFIHDLTAQLETASSDLSDALEPEDVSEDDIDLALENVASIIDGLDFDLP
jgi:hypothetical protein